MKKEVGQNAILETAYRQVKELVVRSLNMLGIMGRERTTCQGMETSEGLLLR